MEAEHSQVLKAAMILPNKNNLVWSDWPENLLLCFRLEPAGPQWLTPGLRKCKCQLPDINL